MYRSAERDQKSRFLGGETVLFHFAGLLAGAGCSCAFIAASFQEFWERYL
ncbi:hypothetical protein CLOM621_05356 [Clostridium sp. M62/1]|nr:hypothetical protein CLOM621_05356 [Clostridium sp. M62/1]